jgi:hypothetical protein
MRAAPEVRNVRFRAGSGRNHAADVKGFIHDVREEDVASLLGLGCTPLLPPPESS